MFNCFYMVKNCYLFELHFLMKSRTVHNVCPPSAVIYNQIVNSSEQELAVPLYTYSAEIAGALILVELPLIINRE